MIQKNDVIVFQGDSVTDCGRSASPSGLGHGYVLMVAGALLATRPGLDLTIYNRGISGNRTKDLIARWDDDCIALRPTVLSILVGINNTWRRYDSADPTDAEVFRGEYKRLLSSARDGGVREIVMLEPFLLPVPEDRKGWREDLDPKIVMCRELAAEFECTYVPLDGIYNAAAAKTGPAYWADDGVHPSVAGHGLIADHWMRATVRADGPV